jgi:hypothetical protein
VFLRRLPQAAERTGAKETQNGDQAWIIRGRIDLVIARIVSDES